MKPLAVDLFCGLGGWTEGLLAEGFYVVGFDIEHHRYGTHKYPAQLVLQDVLTIHGKQFKDAALIVASPPCQEYSYMAMPWTRAKNIAREYRDGTRDTKDLTALFDACFRIQSEAIEAAGHFIPLVVENVRGAIPWVGRSRWNYGSFHLWGDVPALMPMEVKHTKNSGGSWFAVAHNTKSGKGQNPDGRKVPGLDWSTYGQPGYKAQGFNVTAAQHYRKEQAGIKCGGDWFGAGADSQNESGITKGWFGVGNNSQMRKFSSKSDSRKAASAMIAKIPLPLSRHIAATYKPRLSKQA